MRRHSGTSDIPIPTGWTQMDTGRSLWLDFDDSVEMRIIGKIVNVRAKSIKLTETLMNIDNIEEFEQWTMTKSTIRSRCALPEKSSMSVRNP
jgi:hypothetical protein